MKTFFRDKTVKRKRAVGGLSLVKEVHLKEAKYTFPTFTTDFETSRRDEGAMSIQKSLTEWSITLFALLLWRAAGDVNAPCYYPSGDTATGYFACLVQDAYISTCCQTGWTCFSNSLCVVTSPAESSDLNLPIGTSERGACTDPEWSSEVCGGFCLREIPLARFS